MALTCPGKTPSQPQAGSPGPRNTQEGRPPSLTLKSAGRFRVNLGYWGSSHKLLQSAFPPSHGGCRPQLLPVLVFYLQKCINTCQARHRLLEPHSDTVKGFFIPALPVQRRGQKVSVTLSHSQCTAELGLGASRPFWTLRSSATWPVTVRCPVLTLILRHGLLQSCLCCCLDSNTPTEPPSLLTGRRSLLVSSFPSWFCPVASQALQKDDPLLTSAW